VTEKREKGKKEKGGGKRRLSGSKTRNFLRLIVQRLLGNCLGGGVRPPKRGKRGKKEKGERGEGKGGKSAPLFSALTQLLPFAASQQFLYRVTVNAAWKEIAVSKGKRKKGGGERKKEKKKDPSSAATTPFL